MFETDKRIRHDGDFSNGATINRIIVLHRDAPDLDATYAHEIMHVLQRDFLLAAVDRPLERAVRAVLPGANRVPDWLRAGVLVPIALGLERAAFGEGGYTSIVEAEAEWFERWR